MKTRKVAKKESGKPVKILDMIKLDSEVQMRLKALAKINQTTKEQTIAMIVQWYFTRIDSSSKQVKETRSVEKAKQVRAI
jgi:hypothetical protein